MLASIRPDSWNLPLFLHVLAAMILFGATASAAALAWATSKRPALLARAPFQTLVMLAIPSWVVMRVAAQWVESKEDISGDPGWLGVGTAVSDAGLVLLLAATGLAYWAWRRGGAGWQPRAVAALTSLYVVALGVAWWAMSAKP